MHMFSSCDISLKGKDILIFYCYIADEKKLVWKNLFNLMPPARAKLPATEYKNRYLIMRIEKENNNFRENNNFIYSIL